MADAVMTWRTTLDSAARFLGEYAQDLEQHARVLEVRRGREGWHGAQLQQVRTDAFVARNRADWCRSTALGLKELAGSSDLASIVREPGDDVERRLRELLDQVDELGREVTQQRRTRASLLRVAASASEAQPAADTATSVG